VVDETEATTPPPQSPAPTEDEEDAADHEEDEEDEADVEDLEPLDIELKPVTEDSTTPPPPSQNSETAEPGSVESEDSSDSEPLYDDPSDEDDGEGEWITPDNVGYHKSKALDLLPSAKGKGKGKAKDDEVIGVGCMTADFAMQNVLLQMGLNLVSTDGKKIERVKTWTLRCHACFK
jgi:RNA-binding protein NOB1